MLGDAHFHHYCYAGLPRRGGRSITCPSCAVSFDEVKPNYIGEKAVSRAEDDYRGNKKQKRGRPSRAAEEDEEEDEDDEDELEEEEEEQPRRRSQGGSQVTRAGAGPVSQSPLGCPALTTRAAGWPRELLGEMDRAMSQRLSSMTSNQDAAGWCKRKRRCI